MIVITGAAGFIGSFLATHLQYKNQLVLVDDFSAENKNKNFENIQNSHRIDRKEFRRWLELNYSDIEIIFHFGARTDTTEFNREILNELNLDYSKKIWSLCVNHQIPFIYASSAATYGNGDFGYKDSHDIVSKLKPLNPYGESKNDFDKWVLKQSSFPPLWVGLKFFNVYGPNEYHKGRMASVVFHAYNQIKKYKSMKLFKSHNPDFKDGEQLRDFIYVKDIVYVCEFFMSNQKFSGIFNLGSGKARTFKDLVSVTFDAMKINPCIKFIDTPIDIRDKYQYFTQADMSKLKSIGYDRKFFELEDGVNDYVKNYLSKLKTSNLN